MVESRIFTPPGDCSVRTARGIRDDLLAALGGGDHLVIDCAAVERADVTFVQLVASAQRTAHRDGKALTLTNLNGVVSTALARAGFPAAPDHPIA